MTETTRYFAAAVMPGRSGENEYSYCTGIVTFERDLPNGEKGEAQELIPPKRYLKNVDSWNCTLTADAQLSPKALSIITGCPTYPPKRRTHCSRKRFKKILMANGFSRNRAEIWCELITKKWIRSYAEPAKFFTFSYR